MTGFKLTSSSFNYQWKYEVFINFRGEDTRHGFTGNLYNALKKEGVHTFFDDKEIEKGAEITPTLIEAIENSRMAITVFSENYASSTFCLNELLKIHECIKMNKRLVLPIFYDVDPSKVRSQKGNYEEALDKHFQNGKADKEMIQSWKQALHEVANLAGYHFIPGKNGYEHQVIEAIVKGISSKINRVHLHVCDNPIGLESRVKEITSLLQITSNEEVIMVGICGMGGLGKSTIARALYNSIANKFEASCFLNDVKEKSMKVGLEGIQEIILSKIARGKIKIQDVNEGVVKIMEQRFIEKKKILLILDNVDNRKQLEKLAGHCDWFSGGSRIIITTRDRKLLLSHGVQHQCIYNMKAFNTEESLELLSRNAFRKHQVDPSYQDVLNRAILYAQGLPLALEIIGANLHGMRISEWESALDLYERIPEENILQRLKVSYDCLTEEEQNIFLDIACFFEGKELEHAKFMVQQVNDFNTESIISVLVNKCLMKINGNIIKMHDLIRDMGKEIVRKESPNNPGERSRLWFHQDISDVLEDNTGTDKVRMIIQDSYKCIKVNWDGKAFKNMKELKMLNFKNVEFLKSPKYLPNSLRVLKWKGYPYSSLPPKFHPKKLVVLDIENSNLRSLKTIKASNNLGVLNLSDCQNVIKIPDLSNLQNLKELLLKGCKNLTEIDDSIGKLANLEILDAEGCGQLEIFPSAMSSPSLIVLNLIDCSSLKYFPKILEKAKVRNLWLFRTGIKKLPRSICNLSELESLCISKGKSVMKIPNSIFLLPKLQSLEIIGEVKISCNSMESQQQPAIGFEEGARYSVFLQGCNLTDHDIRTTHLHLWINMVFLDLTGNSVTILPSWIEQCHSLKILKLSGCKHLRDVEGIPPNIEILEATNCTSLSLDSKSFILSEELHGERRILDCYDSDDEKIHHFEDEVRYYFCVPSKSMPEWFKHRSQGASISLWFRNSFPPALFLCFLFKPKDHVLYSSDPSLSYFVPMVSINDEEIRFGVGSLYLQWCNGDTVKQFDDHHVVVYQLNDTHEWNSYVDRTLEEIEGHEWIQVHVEVFAYTLVDEYSLEDELPDDSVVIQESGIYVIEEFCDMKDISFKDPRETLDSTCGDHEKFDTWMMKKKEGPLDKKRRLMGDCNFASSSTMFGCTEGGRDRSIINGDNNANEVISHEGASLIDLDLNTALPVLPWTEHACDTFTNQDFQQQENVTTLVNVEQVPIQRFENNKKRKGKEKVIYNDDIHEQ